MAIFTPRGLKIRLPVDLSFALMKRLYPKVDAFTVLKTTEGIESLTPFLTFITGIVCFYLKLSLIEIGLYVSITSILAFLITSFGLYFLMPVIVRLGTFYSYISGFGLLLIFLLVQGLFTVGWQGVLVFFAAKFLAGVIKEPFDFRMMGKRRYGGLRFLTASEENFFNAYRMHARKLGKTTDLSVSAEELRDENWKPCFLDLATKWPEVVGRFTIEDYHNHERILNLYKHDPGRSK